MSRHEVTIRQDVKYAAERVAASWRNAESAIQTLSAAMADAPN